MQATEMNFLVLNDNVSKKRIFWKAMVRLTILKARLGTKLGKTEMRRLQKILLSIEPRPHG